MIIRAPGSRNYLKVSYLFGELLCVNTPVQRRRVLPFKNDKIKGQVN